MVEKTQKPHKRQVKASTNTTIYKKIPDKVTFYQSNYEVSGSPKWVPLTWPQSYELFTNLYLQFTSL